MAEAKREKGVRRSCHFVSCHTLLTDFGSHQLLLQHPFRFPCCYELVLTVQMIRRKKEKERKDFCRIFSRSVIFCFPFGTSSLFSFTCCHTEERKSEECISRRVQTIINALVTRREKDRETSQNLNNISLQQQLNISIPSFLLFERLGVPLCKTNTASAQ